MNPDNIKHRIASILNRGSVPRQTRQVASSLLQDALDHIRNLESEQGRPTFNVFASTKDGRLGPIRCQQVTLDKAREYCRDNLPQLPNGTRLAITSTVELAELEQPPVIFKRVRPL